MKKISLFFILMIFSVYAFSQQTEQSTSSSAQQPASAWSTYLDETSTDTGPSKPLVHALTLFNKQDIHKGLAVDLGAGTGKDTLYLLKNHWNVLALDYSQKSIDIILDRSKALDLPTPQVQVSSFQDMQLPNNIDLVNANLALPFVPQQDFPAIWNDVVDHIRIGGRFCGNFFGESDEFSGKQNEQMTFITKQQLNGLFKDFQIESLSTRQGNYPGADGKMKYWQIWDVVALKVRNS